MPFVPESWQARDAEYLQCYLFYVSSAFGQARKGIDGGQMIPHLRHKLMESLKMVPETGKIGKSIILAEDGTMSSTFPLILRGTPDCL